MKIHTTNYFDTFIEIAADSPVAIGEIPPTKHDTKTIANLQFEMVINNPYRYTSDEVLFAVFAQKNDLIEDEKEDARYHFFSKGQPCFRASPLTKRYGWGVHYDKEGKMAIFGSETLEYKKLSSSANLKIVKAMKSTK